MFTIYYDSGNNYSYRFSVLSLSIKTSKLLIINIINWGKASLQIWLRQLDTVYS